MAVQFPPALLKECWFLAGPTASGKSGVAIELASRCHQEGGWPVEIVSLDSMSLYRGMDIGTAKPSKEEQARVPHHLIDVLDPHEEFSVAEYVAAARDVCEQIVGRGGRPLFVGGTGLYLRGVLRGVFEGPAADWEFRRQLEEQAATESPDFLHRQLAEVDPESAESLHPNDARRLVRALEVHYVTGRPLSEQQQQRALPPEERPRHVYWLSPEREVLYERINSRVDMMVAQGLFEEVQGLLEREKPMGRTARQALGYKEVIDAIEQEAPISDCVNTIKTRTRQFAKRQHTWFRNLTECMEISVAGNESPGELADRLLSMFQSS